nr:Chain Bw, mS29 [Polytomella magna]8APN_Bw Chain Bw, mS29 [Polytomella magna]
SKILVEKRSPELTQEHIGNYYKVTTERVPEGFMPFHQAFYAKPDAGQERKGGCRGIQHEFDISGHHNVMLRSSTLELFDLIKEGDKNRILLSGPTGTGKSVALFSLVEWARQQDWIVLYIPSAFTLTRGGFFYRRPGTDLFDTLTSAQHLLKGLLDCHQAQLAKLPLSSDDSKLLELVQKGLLNDDAHTAVDCCLEVVKELSLAAATQPVLFAIDGYNALFQHTDYGVTEGDIQVARRRLLKVEELTLANSMRLLERADLGKARVVVAPSWSIRSSLQVGKPVETTEFVMPRFDFAETANALYYYQCCGLAPDVPTEKQAKLMQHITNGNAFEIRSLAIKMSMLKLNKL